METTIVIKIFWNVATFYTQYEKHCAQVASEVAAKLKTQDLRKLENIRKTSKLG